MVLKKGFSSNLNVAKVPPEQVKIGFFYANIIFFKLQGPFVIAHGVNSPETSLIE